MRFAKPTIPVAMEFIFKLSLKVFQYIRHQNIPFILPIHFRPDSTCLKILTLLPSAQYLTLIIRIFQKNQTTYNCTSLLLLSVQTIILHSFQTGEFL